MFKKTARREEFSGRAAYSKEAKFTYDICLNWIELQNGSSTFFPMQSGFAHKTELNSYISQTTDPVTKTGIGT